MINKKISTIAGSLIIVAIVAALGFSFLASNKKEKIQNQNNFVSDNLELRNKEGAKQEEEKVIENNQVQEENNGLKISDKWTAVNHKNFWNNSNLFAHKNYSFPNIEFSYPENWDFRCCGDTDYGSNHFIAPTKIHDDALPYIHIIDHSLKGCPGLQDKCSLDKTIKITATNKFDNLTSAISTEDILPKIKLEKLNASAFVYKKVEINNKPSKGYIINLGDRVIEIDFVNYELLDENFIDNFLDHISLESK